MMPITVGMALLLLFSTSCRKSGQQPNLHDRIGAADTSKYCRLPDACFNPFVVAVDGGYDVTTFLGSKPQHAHIPTKEVTRYLQALPMQAWPRGPSIEVSLTDFSIDQHAVEQNFYAAQQLFRSMGLEVHVRPAG